MLAELSVLSRSNSAADMLVEVPTDDEPFATPDAEAIEEGNRDFERRQTVADAELRAHLGP